MKEVMQVASLIRQVVFFFLNNGLLMYVLVYKCAIAQMWDPEDNL